MSNVIEFPIATDIAYRGLAKEIKADDSLSEFMREELGKRIPAALKPLSGMKVCVDVPGGLTPEQSAALVPIAQQVCDQYAHVFMGCLSRAVTKHVALIEDLRKAGVTVQMRERDGL